MLASCLLQPEEQVPGPSKRGMVKSIVTKEIDVLGIVQWSDTSSKFVVQIVM